MPAVVSTALANVKPVLFIVADNCAVILPFGVVWNVNLVPAAVSVNVSAATQSKRAIPVLYSVSPYPAEENLDKISPDCNALGLSTLPRAARPAYNGYTPAPKLSELIRELLLSCAVNCNNVPSYCVARSCEWPLAVPIILTVALVGSAPDGVYIEVSPFLETENAVFPKLS